MIEDKEKYDFGTSVHTLKYRRHMKYFAHEAKTHLEHHNQWMVNILLVFKIHLIGNKDFQFFSYYLLAGETSKGFGQSQLGLKATS